MRNNRQTGRLAEDLATQALTAKNYQILHRNFQNRYGEIDIIAKDQEILVFVEVKAKKGLNFGSPEEMINPFKLKKVQNMAIVYLQGSFAHMKGQNLPCRIDVIAVVLSATDELISLTHYENVYI